MGDPVRFFASMTSMIMRISLGVDLLGRPVVRRWVLAEGGWVCASAFVSPWRLMSHMLSTVGMSIALSGSLSGGAMLTRIAKLVGMSLSCLEAFVATAEASRCRN